MDLSVEDLFIAKSISNVQPIKMLGEWVNDVEHPRDTSEAISYTLLGAWNPVRPDIRKANEAGQRGLQEAFAPDCTQCCVFANEIYLSQRNWIDTPLRP